MHARLLAPVAALMAATPAFAQTEDASALTVSGSAMIATDYRLRGVSQTDENPALQGGITVTHDSGLYGSIWGSNLAGWGTFGGANLELDFIAGYKAKLGDSATLDAGVTLYTYPGGADRTTYYEPFAKLSGTTGRLTLLAGVAYAPSQQALGKWYANGTAAAAGTYTDAGDKEDNLYLWGDGALGLAGTPLTAKAHIGWSKGNDGLGPNATSIAPTGEYWDWSLGVDTTWKNLTFNVSYVDTDISRGDAARLQPSFSKGQDGTGSIADGAVVASLTATF